MEGRRTQASEEQRAHFPPAQRRPGRLSWPCDFCPALPSGPGWAQTPISAVLLPCLRRLPSLHWSLVSPIVSLTHQPTLPTQITRTAPTSLPGSELLRPSKLISWGFHCVGAFIPFATKTWCRFQTFFSCCLTRTACPTIQLNSDTSRPELAQTPHV